MPRKTDAVGVRRGGGRGASMRPRPDAAENEDAQLLSIWTKQRFNEAAARCRGKLAGGAAPRGDRACRFNEAAARCRGKRWSMKGSEVAV